MCVYTYVHIYICMYVYIYRELYMCIYIGEEETDNEEVKLINRYIYHCKQEPRAEFQFNVFGKGSVSILIIHAAQTNIFC